MENLSEKDTTIINTLTKIPLALIIPGALGLVISLIILFVNNNKIEYIVEVLSDWIFYFPVAVIIFVIINIYVYAKPAYEFCRYFSLIVLMTPLAEQAFRIESFGILKIAYYPCIVLDILVCVYVITILMSRQFYVQIGQYLLGTLPAADSENLTRRRRRNEINIQLESAPQNMLGQGTSILDNIIKSINFRADLAAKMTKTALVLMIVIVIAGGGFSIGTVAINELVHARELKEQKNKLTALITNIKTAQKTNANPSHIKKNEQSTPIDSADFAEYSTKLDAMAGEKISGADIGMRATIAIFTLFLVQVFFQIYKYNQRQSINLYAKAEVIQLFVEDVKNVELRKKLLAKLESDIAFGKDPTTPIEQITSALSKLKKAVG